jgi:hypothetical protein
MIMEVSINFYQTARPNIAQDSYLHNLKVGHSVSELDFCLIWKHRLINFSFIIS